jgi:hypothetical protein
MTRKSIKLKKGGFLGLSIITIVIGMLILIGAIIGGLAAGGVFTRISPSNPNEVDNRISPGSDGIDNDKRIYKILITGADDQFCKNLAANLSVNLYNKIDCVKYPLNDDNVTTNVVDNVTTSVGESFESFKSKPLFEITTAKSKPLFEITTALITPSDYNKISREIGIAAPSATKTITIIEPPPPPQPNTGLFNTNSTKILFIGNSLTYVNNLPGLLDAFTANTDHPTHSTFMGSGGLKLSQHIAGTPSFFYDTDYNNYRSTYHKYDHKILNEIRTRKYKYVIIQDQSSGLDLYRDQMGALTNKLKFMINSCINKTADVPVGWKDSDGNMCHLYDGTDSGYIGQNWCTSDGNYSNHWKKLWGTFEDNAKDDVTALDICCGCGGGTPALLPEELDVSELFSHITYESGSTPVFMKPATPRDGGGLMGSVYRHYDYVAETYKTMLADCGAAIEDIKNVSNYDNNTLYTDSVHPTKFSQFLSACVICNTLFDKKSSDVSYKPSGINNTDSDNIKTIADKIVSIQRNKYKDTDTIRVLDNNILSGSNYESKKVPTLDKDGNPTLKTFPIIKMATESERKNTFDKLPTEVSTPPDTIITNASIPEICKKPCDSGSGRYRINNGTAASCATHAVTDEYTLCPTYASHCDLPCYIAPGSPSGECKKISAVIADEALCMTASSNTCTNAKYSYCPYYMFPKG